MLISKYKKLDFVNGRSRLMINKIELDEIDTSVAEDNFIKLLDESKTYFLNGTWGSGKSEFLHKVENKTEKKMIYLDLWNVKDNRTVMNIVFYKLSGLNEYCLKVIIILCVITSILMSNVVNLGIATRLGISNSHILLQLAGIIALFVATFQVLKIQSDNIFVFFLSKTRMKNKVLVIDDFDRVESKKQEEAYKMFNILNNRLPIVFVGDYTKIANNEGNYLQKIIDRRIELPYILHPQSIWNDYFIMLEELLNFEIHVELKNLIISEKRNLREQFHFNDYINLEFIEKNKLGHVQVNQQLMIIYLYLFHNNLYQLLLDGWTPEYDLPEGKEYRTFIPGWGDNAIFKNSLEETIDHVLYNNDVYPTCYEQNKQGYFVFENINNLSLYEINDILSDNNKLRDNLFKQGEIGTDFYRYLTSIYNQDKLRKNPNILDIQTQERIIENIFKLLLEEKYSSLLTRLADAIYGDWSYNNDVTVKERDLEAIKFYEMNYLKLFDTSQKVHFFLEILKRVSSEVVYDYYMEEVKEIIDSDELYSKQINKPYLLSMLALNNHRHWIYIEEWPAIIFERIEDLNDAEFIEFWNIYRFIDLEYSRNGRLEISKISEITINRVSYDERGKPVVAYNHVIELFEERLREISLKNNIEINYNK